MVFESLKKPLTDGGPTLRHFPATNMTLRDWFAGQALEHDLVYYVRLNPAISPAEARWMFADDMLRAREVKP